MHFYDKERLCAIGFAIAYCVGVNERENPKSGIELLQSKINYHVRIKEYIYRVYRVYKYRVYTIRFRAISGMF